MSGNAFPVIGAKAAVETLDAGRDALIIELIAEDSL
jgi:hypothetical protein